MRGKITKKQNNWYIAKVSEGDETDAVELVYYPIAFSESRDIELIEGLEVEFKTEVVDYINEEGFGQEHFIWGIIL
jgi:uncharacterized protein YjaG (DUF416 family)